MDVDTFLTLMSIYATAAYITLGICFYTMAKKAGKPEIAWCAWAPIANCYLIGELSGMEGGGTLGAVSVSIALVFGWIVVPVLSLLICLGVFAIFIVLLVNVCKRFSHSGWLVIALFLPIINLFAFWSLSQGKYIPLPKTPVDMPPIAHHD